jgi:hypothetical protein
MDVGEVEAVPTLLICIVRMDSSTTVVAVAGEVDLGSAPQLHRHLLVLPDRDTVLDMSGVSLLAAAGLTAAEARVPSQPPRRSWRWGAGAR